MTNNVELTILLTIFTLSCTSVVYGQSTASDNIKLQQPVNYRSGLDTLTWKGNTTTPPVSIMSAKRKIMPFFCHLEHKFAIKSGIPVKFRIGNVQYVDKLEGKN